MKNVPNIVKETGVSSDYSHAFQTIEGYIIRIDKKQSSRSVRLARGTFLDRRILRYTDYFDSGEYEDVVTEFNANAVKKLDELVLEANNMRNELRNVNSLPYARLVDVWRRVNNIIYTPLEKSVLESL